MEQYAAIRLTAVAKAFQRRGKPTVHAVRGIDLRINTGEIVALLGPNGAGKTTTLDMILGLAAPTSGTIEVLGTDPRAAVRSGKLSALLQSGGLLADLTVAETATIIRSVTPGALPVHEALLRAGIAEIADRRVGLCSGGQQQRLKFALALLPAPDILVLDEPTTGMDVTARRGFWDAMRAEAKQGRTILFATHYLEEADDFADRVVLIAEGRVIADGPTEQVRATTMGRTVTARLDPRDEPGIRALLADQPGVRGLDLHGDRVSITTTDSDTLARLLLNHTSATDLEITSASLEAAFVALTSTREEATQ
ncbi:ABC transporter ATP-binding protein [Hoyosella sp. G463]|uniref:ABC transporter ATP-binding protein n=1 Tax=Lolliginicoccus lacisalsi TaxID=2742202 RepID=A0A927PLY3_9ACTN|nr:ABC transporter ATP-binding protein [Lolliginicoccus lacisalsi]MBD8507650.1 ABC transporter ATP-binding protein [Lolliginicoccus lacisalsi]